MNAEENTKVAVELLQIRFPVRKLVFLQHLEVDREKKSPATHEQQKTERGRKKREKDGNFHSGLVVK